MSFLKPDIFKIIFLLAIILLTYLIPRGVEICVEDENCEKISSRGLGLPMFYGNVVEDNLPKMEFIGVNFLINLVLYYIISCLLYFILSRIF